MLKKTNQLSENQLAELEQLKISCKTADESIPNLYCHLLTQPRTFPTIALYYEEQLLVGFLSVYFFYEDAVEMSLLVHPEFRRKNIAQQLIASAIPLIQEQNYDKLIFSSPAHLNDQWLPAMGFIYKHSEYYMERNNLSPLLDHQKRLHFRPATIEDIPKLCTLDEACFHKNHAELLSRFQHILNNRNYLILLAYDKKELVGKAHLRWQDHGATLSDIAVFPNKQGKGLGTTLITHCINFALSEGKPHLNLDVETHNKKALELYTRLGFQTQNACDYWEIEIKQLKKWLPISA